MVVSLMVASGAFVLLMVLLVLIFDLNASGHSLGRLLDRSHPLTPLMPARRPAT